MANNMDIIFHATCLKIPEQAVPRIKALSFEKGTRFLALLRAAVPRRREERARRWRAVAGSNGRAVEPMVEWRIVKKNERRRRPDFSKGMFVDFSCQVFFFFDFKRPDTHLRNVSRVGDR